MSVASVLVTGSSGLIGSESVRYFDQLGWRTFGIDNNLRRFFFGAPGDTSWNLELLRRSAPKYTHYDFDIRDRQRVDDVIRETSPELIIHCAAQPSHDKAREIPLVDFEVNALGTLVLLEAVRQHCPESVFILMSTNKVYGDTPNRKQLVELPTRYDYELSVDLNGIDETCPIDQTLHSLFGVSKASADLLAQEYGRYFGMNVGVFRGGCLTGPGHSGVELHGFLSYLVQVAFSGQPYTINGYKGKQVRDNLHSRDVVHAFAEFAANPRPGEVFNLGGGRANSISILEAIQAIESLTERKISWVYDDMPRRGDHICYISDMSKFKTQYPKWNVTRSVGNILEELVHAHRARVQTV